MPRPCRCTADPPAPYAGGCRLCYLYAHDPRYRAMWDGVPRLHPAPAGRPCAEFADAVPVSGPERERLSLPHARDYRACPRPDSPHAGRPVCPCDQCRACPLRVAA